MRKLISVIFSFFIAVPSLAVEPIRCDAEERSLLSEGQTFSHKILGMSVFNHPENDVGRIASIMIQDGKIAGYVLSIGGFLGLGAKPILVATNCLSPITGRSGNAAAKVAMTNEELIAAPWHSPK